MAEPIHRGLIAAQVHASRAIDRLVPPEQDRSLDCELTALVKTFERPAVAARLVASIRALYPSMPVIVVDDSREPRPLHGVETVVLPYDSGVSAGRQAGLDRVRTPFVLILDDDFVFYRGTQLGPALGRIRRHPEIDILGGQLIDLPFLRRLPPPIGEIFQTTARPRRPIGTHVGGMPVCDKVANFYIARTEQLRQVGWDPALKRLDHADFFTRALGVLVSVFDRELRCLHAQTPFDDQYMALRTDTAADDEVLVARWDLR